MSDQTNASTPGGVATPDTPGRPAYKECRHWIGPERRHCKEIDGVRLYVTGHRCPTHTPAALQGKPETPPGPGWPIFRTEEP
ncbi:hypothetical protein ACFWP7_13250 [Streptomyces sp. NPDC058470]|uniref:hypothetical protein n=1 Tax=Streptomyces sp. NPDC058470 TaxID=3346515 RepID=UPI003648AD06